MLRETILRSKLAGTFERIGGRDLNVLSSIIEETYGGLIRGKVSNKLLVDTTLAAVRHDRWTGGTDCGNRVGVGYYSNEAVYNTNFSHETCHNVLGQLGRPDSIYGDHLDMANEEEQLCWRFSAEISRMANLPFSKEVVDLSDAYRKFVLELATLEQSVANSEAYANALANIGQAERKYLGYSQILGDKFHWDGDVPKLL